MGALNGPTPASVVIVSFRSARYLPRALTALAEDPEGPAEVIVVDNASDDDSAAIAREAGAVVVEAPVNEGFAAGCHRGADRASQDVVVFLNPDAVPLPGWLPPLVAALDAGGVAAASPTLELTAEPGHYNSSGGGMTFYGLAWASDVGEPVGHLEAPVETPFPTGAAMAMRKEMWQMASGFRRDFFMYYEDADLGWRLRLRGLSSVRVPGSVVRHDYDFGRNPNKMFHLERNRLIALRSNYRVSTRVLLAPALGLAGLGITMTAVRDRWLPARVRAWFSAWGRADRAAAQGGRAVGDATIIDGMAPGIAGMSQVRSPRGAGAVEGVFRWWLRLVLPVVRWVDRRHGLA